jgi:ABC-type nitrate/sulfonate/bicarbonate transport system substrate-binding protein
MDQPSASSSRRSFLYAVGFAALAVPGTAALSACGASATAADASGGTRSATAGGGATRALGLQLSFLPNVQFGGSFLADEQGYYAAEGLRVTFLPGGPNVSTEPIVMVGKARVGITHTSELAQAITNGAELTVIGAGYQKNPFCLISQADSAIRTPQEMVGKKIGVATANVPVYEAFLKANGISPARVSMVTVQFDPTPVASREVDAMIGFYTNEAVQLAMSGVPVSTLMLNDHGYPLLEELYIVRTADLHNSAKRRDIKAFMRAERRGWQKCVDDPNLAAQITVSRYGAAQRLNLAQQQAEAVKQKELVIDRDTAAHGLFWMTDEKVAATRTSLALGGVAIDARAFSNEILAEL